MNNLLRLAERKVCRTIKSLSKIQYQINLHNPDLECTHHFPAKVQGHQV